MKLSTRTRYGVRALLEIAKDWGIRQTKRKDIKKKQNISLSYLENILVALKSNGLVKTNRGAKGGFTLTRPPSEITLFDVFIILEGSIAPVECAEDRSRCARSAACVMRGVYERMTAAQEEVLRSVTLQTLAEQMKGENQLEYCI